jgi:hypothetical protein
MPFLGGEACARSRGGWKVVRGGGTDGTGVLGDSLDIVIHCDEAGQALAATVDTLLDVHGHGRIRRGD